MAYISSIERRANERGFKQGIQQGECSLLMRLLKSKFQSVPESYQQRLSAANPEELLLWAERVLSVDSLDEVFEDKNQ